MAVSQRSAGSDAVLSGEEARRKVIEIVQNGLQEHFKGRLTFPVLAAALDEIDGRQYVYITIVVNGKVEQMIDDMKWAVRWFPNLRSRLLEAGVEAFPLPEVIEKAEWDELDARDRSVQTS